MSNGKNTSAQPHITYNVDEACVLTKSEIKEYVNRRLDILCPDNKSQFTKRLLVRSSIYIEGYANRLKEEMSPPVNVSDVKTFLLSECFKYIWKKIEG